MRKQCKPGAPLPPLAPGNEASQIPARGYVTLVDSFMVPSFVPRLYPRTHEDTWCLYPRNHEDTCTWCLALFPGFTLVLTKLHGA